MYFSNSNINVTDAKQIPEVEVTKNIEQEKILEQERLLAEEQKKEKELKKSDLLWFISSNGFSYNNYNFITDTIDINAYQNKWRYIFDLNNKQFVVEKLSAYDNNKINVIVSKKILNSNKNNNLLKVDKEEYNIVWFYQNNDIDYIMIISEDYSQIFWYIEVEWLTI